METFSFKNYLLGETCIVTQMGTTHFDVSEYILKTDHYQVIIKHTFLDTNTS